FAAKRVANCLMPQANTKNRYFPRETLNQRHANPRLARRARPRRNNNALRTQLLHFVERNRVVPPHFELLPHLAKILRQVIGKRIVVIEQQNHYCFRACNDEMHLPEKDLVVCPVPRYIGRCLPWCAISTATTSARALLIVS